MADRPLARALDDHFRVQVIAYGHIAPKGVVHVSDHAVLAHCGFDSIFNRGTALALDQPDVALGEVERFFGGGLHSLWLHADEIDDDRESLLRQRGYEPFPSVAGLARDLPADDVPIRDDHRTRLLTDPGLAGSLAEVVSAGYGFGADDRMIIEDVVRNVLRHAKPFDHGAVYGVDDGADAVVSMGMMLCTADMAGLSTYATDVPYRHRGMATAIITRALHDAHAIGLRHAGVVTNPDSRRLFEELGFEEVSRYRVFRWVGTRR